MSMEENEQLERSHVEAKELSDMSQQEKLIEVKQIEDKNILNSSKSMSDETIGVYDEYGAKLLHNNEQKYEENKANDDEDKSVKVLLNDISFAEQRDEKNSMEFGGDTNSNVNVSDFDEAMKETKKMNTDNMYLSIQNNEKPIRRHSMWNEYIDPQTKNVFYMNTETRMTQWERPPNNELDAQLPLNDKATSSHLTRIRSKSAFSSSNSSSHFCSMTLTEATERQHNTFTDLVKRERQYAKHLESLFHVFVRPLQTKAQQELKTADILKIPAFAVLLNNVHHIWLVTSQILKDFENLLSVSSAYIDKTYPTGKVMMRYTEILRVYGRFAEHYGLVKNDLLRSVSSDHEMKQFLASVKNNLPSFSRQHTLITLLELILSHVGLYLENLEHQILQVSDSGDEHDILSSVVSFMRNLSEYIKEASEARPNMELVKSIEKEFVGNIALCRPGRRFVRKGELGKCNRRGNIETVIFHLFNDMVIYSRKKGNTLNIRRMISLNGCCVVLDDKDRQKFTLTSSSKSFVVYTSNAHKWARDIQRCIEETQNRHNVMHQSEINTKDAPLWEPDSERFSCMTCDESFSLLRRRHHCRSCGKLVCGSCSSARQLLVNISNQAVRVCDVCVQQPQNIMQLPESTQPRKRSSIVRVLSGQRSQSVIGCKDDIPLPQTSFRSHSVIEKHTITKMLPPDKLSTRHQIASELLSTEISYLTSLEFLLNTYIRPLLRKLLKISMSKILTSDSTLRRKSIKRPNYQNCIVAVFCDSIEFILTLNCKLLQQLNVRLEKWNESTCVGDVFNGLSGVFKVYGDYAVHADEVAQILESSDYSAFLKRCELCSSTNSPPKISSMNSLQSLLIMPIQRVPRYLLFIKELIKNTPSHHSGFSSLQKSLSNMNVSATHINDVISHRDAREEVMRLEDRFIGTVSLASPTRHLIREGTMLKCNRRRASQSVVLHLFNDILVYSLSTPLGLLMKRTIMLESATVKLDPDRDDIVEIGSPSKSFQLMGKPTDIIEWSSQIQACIEALRYTDSSPDIIIAPVLVPNASAQKCTLCQSSFSIFNRRHHCRMCGQIYCSECSPREMILENINAEKPQRVCVQCEKPQKDQNVDALTRASMSVAAPIFAQENRAMHSN